jgi:hypothetical protein
MRMDSYALLSQDVVCSACRALLRLMCSCWYRLLVALAGAACLLCTLPCIKWPCLSVALLHLFICSDCRVTGGLSVAGSSCTT